jgi:hypothetical protein
MVTPFKSARQERIFSDLLRKLRAIGYSNELVARAYSLSDWFHPSSPVRVVPAAVFGRTPFSYDSACFAVLLPDGKQGLDLVYDFRALGAPLAFEVDTDSVTYWRVGAERDSIVPCGRFQPGQLDAAFEEHAEDWSPGSMLRAKNITFELGPRQLDFIDLGLLPALESHIREKLDRLLREALAEAIAGRSGRAGQRLDAVAIFRLVFHFLAAKVLHDRQVPGFKSLPLAEADSVLERVATYYGDAQPVAADRRTKDAVAATLWRRFDFANLSVEVLAHIYENTLVDALTRKKLGIHSTPPSIARYIVHRLPFEDFPQEERRVVEPCSGSGVFLVAALQRLRELLPGDFTDTMRHRYFTKMLHGYETDPFALEISKLCLVLADLPNPNGWSLHQEDVFDSPAMLGQLRRARIVLCNPPFEDFTEAERRKYGALASAHKPAELLHRVLRHLHREGILGFVLPRSFVDGRGYREIREALARRYRELEVVALPDRVFSNSDLESALLLAHSPGESVSHVSLAFARVGDAERQQFLSACAVSQRGHAVRTPEELAGTMAIPPFREIWERLAHNPTLGEVAEVHRGVEWKPPFRKEQHKYISSQPKPGFKRGLLKVTDQFTGFLPPNGTVYLSIRPEHRRGGAFEYPWEEPKLISNAARLSRGMWRLAAFIDCEGLVCSQNFHGVWPRKVRLEFLEAVLNGPIASAFIADHEGGRHVTKTTLSRLPLPREVSAHQEVVAKLVAGLRSHLAEAENQNVLMRQAPWQKKARELLLAVDAAVLRAYDLPPRLERALLDAFSGQQRRVPFPFTQYHDRDFAPFLPLWMVTSRECAGCNARFLLRNIPHITDPELVAALEEIE